MAPFSGWNKLGRKWTCLSLKLMCLKQKTGTNCDCLTAGSEHLQKSSQLLFIQRQFTTKVVSRPFTRRLGLDNTLLEIIHLKIQHSPTSKYLATVARKNCPLWGRNSEQTPAVGGRPSALTGWVAGLVGCYQLAVVSAHQKWIKGAQPVNLPQGHGLC